MNTATPEKLFLPLIIISPWRKKEVRISLPPRNGMKNAAPFLQLVKRVGKLSRPRDIVEDKYASLIRRTDHPGQSDIARRVMDHPLIRTTS